MAEAIQRRDQWWQERRDGSLIRWNEAESRWEEQDAPPPPPDAAPGIGLARPIGAEVTSASFPKEPVAVRPAMGARVPVMSNEQGRFL